MSDLSCQAGGAYLSDVAPKQLSVRQQLEQQKASLLDRLKDVESALSALDENPGVEKVLTLVGRTVRF